MEIRTTSEKGYRKEIDPLIVIASNRGPFSFSVKKDSAFKIKRGAGGLVTALGALFEHHNVLWVASALSRGDHLWAKQHLNQARKVQGINLRLITPQKKRYDQYYNVISNPLLWFIQHQLWDTTRHPSITGETWDAWHKGYVAINRQLAEAIADSVRDTASPMVILPQDYHLYLVPRFLREQLGDRAQIQPFIHIPWPSPDAWRILPAEMRSAILYSLLMSDRVGFQTQKDAFNFVQTCRFYLPDAHSWGSRDTLHYQGRTIRARTYPISIDVEKVLSIAKGPEAQRWRKQIRDFLGNRRVILRIDRVEPSKNVLRGLEAYRTLLAAHPEHRGRVQMLALFVPSRMEVHEYQSYLQEIMAETGFINAEFGDGTWEPVRIILGDNYPRAIAAMQLYDVLLVNPIADGMNLVAKEGVLVNQRNGVLVLSEYAGAFYELGDHALTVAPFDTYSTAQTLHRALTMPEAERRSHAEALRAQVQTAGVKEWFYTQLEDALRAFNSQAKKSSTSDMP